MVALEREELKYLDKELEEVIDAIMGYSIIK